MPLTSSRAARLRIEPLEDRSVPAFLTPVVTPGVFSAVGDFNHDGRADLVVLDPSAGTVAVRLARADGTFQPTGPTASAAGFGVATADFDGDGNRDVLVGGAGGVALLRGVGDGTLRPAVSTPVRLLSAIYRERLTTLEVADVNNDGRSDVVARGSYNFSDRGGDSGSGDYLVVLLARADGTFAAAGDLMGLGGESRSRGTTLSSSPTPYAYHTGDFNGDGKADLLFVASAKGTKKVTPYPSQILLGKGDGTFDTAHPLPENWVNVDLVAADVNGDRKTDVLQAGQDGAWKVLLGSGSGTFTQSDKVNIPAAPEVADLNGDGTADLVSVDPASGAVSVLLGKGAGKFKAPQAFAGGIVPAGGIFLGDFNGDGRRDIAAGDGSRISVLLNDGRW